MDGKVSKSVSELKATSEQKYSNFFNLNLILILEEIKRNNFDKAKVKADADAYKLPDELAAIDMAKVEAEFYN